MHSIRPRFRYLIACLIGVAISIGIRLYFNGLGPSGATPIEQGTDVASTGQTQSSVSQASSPETEQRRATSSQTYIKVIEGCGPEYSESCVYAYSGPSEDEARQAPLRRGTVLPVSSTEVHGDRTWYVVYFTEPIRYPERVSLPWYIPSEHTAPFEDVGTLEMGTNTPTSTKAIYIDRSDQFLRAYEGDTVFMELLISTGLELTPTPRGQFSIYRKTPSRYMQGPIPGISTKYYNLPGVPWNLYFTKEGGVIHGTYWHNKFGQPWSNGCVNLPYDDAERLYRWADLGTAVIVQD